MYIYSTLPPLLLLSALMLVPTATASSLFSKTPHELVSEEIKQHYQADVPAGPIRYIEANASQPQSGFRAEKLHKTTGHWQQQVIDFGVHSSAEQLFSQVRRKLLQNRFAIAYECAGSDCGEPDGFRSYFSNRLGGDATHQHYFVAIHNRETVAFYVSDYGPRPRGLLIRSGPGAVIDTTTLISFASGNADLDPAATQATAHWAKRIANTSGVLVIAGHADASGDPHANLQLAQARAETVRAALIDHGIAAERLAIRAMGEWARTVNGARGRYVEILPAEVQASALAANAVAPAGTTQ